jgi:hypothetical protein
VPGTTKAGSLDDEFAEFAAARVTVRCHICKLDDGLREWVDAKLRDGVPVAPIAEFLSAKGHKMGTSAVRNHGRSHVS